MPSCAVQIWSHEGRLYEVNSLYALSDGAWHYELVGLTGAPGTGPYLAVALPDATPIGPFTPLPARHALMHVGQGDTPWPILRRLLDLVQESGDLVADEREASTVGQGLSTNNVWPHDGRTYEVNSFHHGERDAWCIEMYEVGPGDDNVYVEVLIPDVQPEGGPFLPAPADRVTFTAHGDWAIPWPVFVRFIEAVEAAGDIVVHDQV